MQTITTCKACHKQFTGKYCNYCGEKRYTDHDRTIKHFVEEGIHFVTHFEGTFFTTVKYLFTRPGKLSADYCYGIRKTLFKPLSLFLLLCIIYLLFPVFEGLNMRLYYHTNGSIYSGFAKHEVMKVMQQHNWTNEQMAEAFHHQSTKVSKFLLLVLLPLTALFFWLLTYKKRRYFFDQMVFATEINSVYLIWGFMILPLLLSLFEFIYGAFAHHAFPFTDTGIGLVMYALLLVYVVLASRRFYGIKTGYAIFVALLFLVAHHVIVQFIYKFILFITSIKLVK
ncbi:MAG: DUF3667 domain-containing protein [Chitinophagaceae bacterium]|nr:MAG: DUF3667 domain-containing protein [Chitinophagaceae bacterium]